MAPAVAAAKQREGGLIAASPFGTMPRDGIFIFCIIT
jgi:hypothetical protein